MCIVIYSICFIYYYTILILFKKFIIYTAYCSHIVVKLHNILYTVVLK